VKNLTCFKAYDIRGRIPDDLNEEVAYRIGRAYAAYLKPRQIILGYDVRNTSLSLLQALIDGLNDSSVDIINIGLCGTEEVYFATFNRNTDGGIMVTASHNPIEYNGMKLVREYSRPISEDTGLNDIRQLAEDNDFYLARRKGECLFIEDKSEYVKHLMSYIDIAKLKPMKVVVNAGNGSAGLIIDLLEKHLPFEFVKINHEPDGTFPNGIPNPLLPDNRETTAKAVIENQADVGIAWDGDFDRCFFYDEQGRFIESYYLVGILAINILQDDPNGRVIHDSRLIWNTIEMVRTAGGKPIQCKGGHSFIKERMRNEDAVYAGEMSAHHYFRNFAYCDSGMIPWMLLLQHMSVTNQSLSELVEKRIGAFSCSGELNFRVNNIKQIINKVLTHYTERNPIIEKIDGVSVEFSNWRFNIRSSNTEPLLRLNLETRGDISLMHLKTKELTELINKSLS